MLIELAVGDAYGAGFEYANENNPYNNLARYVQQLDTQIMALRKN